MSPNMELLAWVGDFGLTSISAECIRAIVYIKLSKAPVKIIYSKNPPFIRYEDFPIFRHGAILITDFNDMICYLRVHNYVIDHGLSGKEISAAYTLINLVLSNLRPVLHYVFWIDTRNFEELTSSWFTKVMPVPSNFIYPRSRRKAADSLMEIICPRMENMDELKDCITKKAMESFSYLSWHLGNKSFFYGNCPTTVDTTVYAYLAPLVKIPFPSDNISQILGTYPELLKFVERIDKKLFSDVVYGSKYIKKGSSTTKAKDKDEDELVTSKTMKIFLFAAATCIMLGYAASKKIVDLDRWRQINTD